MLEWGLMLTTRSRASSGRRWTYADYCRLPADGQRHELLAGRHVVAPAPDIEHQAVVLQVGRRLAEQVQDPGAGVVLLAPVDLHLRPCTVLQPDVMVVIGRLAEFAGRAKITSAPALVVEVLSPSTSRRDRGAKSRLYAKAGVREYWIVDPTTRTGDAFELVDGSYVQRSRGAAVLQSVAFTGVRVDLR